MYYEHQNVARSTNVFIDNKKYQNWIYETLIRPIGISREHIKNNWTDSCCGINFNVFQKGDWCHPHKDVNPSKINFLLQGSQSIFFPEDNINWDYQFPAMLNVSKTHTVTQLDDLKIPRITLQIFLIEKIEYYAGFMRRQV